MLFSSTHWKRWCIVAAIGPSLHWMRLLCLQNHDLMRFWAWRHNIAYRSDLSFHICTQRKIFSSVFYAISSLSDFKTARHCRQEKRASPAFNQSHSRSQPSLASETQDETAANRFQVGPRRQTRVHFRKLRQLEDKDATNEEVRWKCSCTFTSKSQTHCVLDVVVVVRTNTWRSSNFRLERMSISSRWTDSGFATLQK